MSPESSAALNRRRARLRRIPEIRSQKPEARIRMALGPRISLEPLEGAA
jgi:hypothetical protein